MARLTRERDDQRANDAQDKSDADRSELADEIARPSRRVSFSIGAGDSAAGPHRNGRAA